MQDRLAYSLHAKIAFTKSRHRKSKHSRVIRIFLRMAFALEHVLINSCTAILHRYKVRKTQIVTVRHRPQGGDSQNFLRKFIRFFVTLGLKILRLFNLKVLFETNIIEG